MRVARNLRLCREVFLNSVRLGKLQSRACRHVARSIAADPALQEELSILENLPPDHRSARLHLAALDRGIRRELPDLISVQRRNDSDTEAVVGRSTGQSRAMCRRFKAG